MSSKPAISCGAVVYKKDKDKTCILLVKQANNSVGWGIPKGHMERGESYAKTAIREVFEEAGVNIKVVARLPHVVLEKGTYKKVVIPYLAVQTCDSIPRCDHKMSEVVDVRWFDTNDLPQIYSYQKPIIDAALLILEGYLDG
jgi:ADP-ribose pyrophosphatase YjhB (NUDIX family)